MKILVTGASGFLGLNLLKQIVQAHPEAKVIATDIERSIPEDHPGLNPQMPQLSWGHLDVCDADACGDLLRTTRPTHIIHASAVTLPDDSADSIQRTTEVNFMGAKNIFKAATTAGSVHRVLLLSSSGLYDQATDNGACDEEHALDLSSAYAQTKRQAEMLMAEYEEMGKFAILSARIGPVYGEFERIRQSRPNVSMMQRLFDHLLSDNPIRVSGTEMHRDWTHAADVATALDLLLFAPHLHHRIYNVSTGVSVSSRYLIDLFAARGLKVTWVDNPEAADLVCGAEQGRKALVIDRLKRDTGFTPGFDIEAGIAQVVSAWKHEPRLVEFEETAG